MTYDMGARRRRAVALQAVYDQSYPPDVLGGGPTPPSPPVLATIAPTTAVVNAAITITATGSNFAADAQIRAGVVGLTTTRVSATELTAAYTAPATAQTVQITVRNVADDTTSQQRALTITAAEELAAEPPPEV